MTAETITYNDGRPGHSGVRGTVLQEDSQSMVVQFDDRMEPSFIRKDDPRWMRFIRRDDKPKANHA